jgi:hypothetical protein
MFLTPKTLAVYAAAITISTASIAASYSNDASLLVQQAAIRHHVPVAFALQVARQETGGKGGRCGLRGSHGEVGPLQILPSTARAMGYRGVSGATCEAQTDAGMAHLAYCYQHTATKWLAAACHNQGASVAAGSKVTYAARKYANAVMRSVAYPAQAFAAPAKFARIVAPAKSAIKHKTTRYKCNWTNCPK